MTDWDEEDKWEIAKSKGQVSFMSLLLSSKWFGGQKKVRCKECGQYYPIKKMKVDHIRPLSEDKINEISNLQLLCLECKKRRDEGELVVGTLIIPLLRDLWKSIRKHL